MASPDQERGPGEARDRLALALDVGDLAAAGVTARRLAPWFGIAKVGLELWAEAGPVAVDTLADLGFRVFADLKLHDIPTTVGRAARALGRLRVDFLNLHAAGGETMLRAGVEGLVEGAREAGRRDPIALAVTVLTSDSDVSEFPPCLDAAVAARCDGVVCSVSEVGVVHARGAGLKTMVPGIRLPDDDHHDHARAATPGDAIAAGGDWLVVGRAVTAAPDPERAARAVTRAVDEALAARVRGPA